MTFEPIEHEPDDYEDADTPARPSVGRTGAFPRRFWRALTGRRDVVPAAALDAAYRERAHLVALLAAWRASHIGYNDPARHCGIRERLHFDRWSGTVGWHAYVPPTDEQVKARMQMRRGVK